MDNPETSAILDTQNTGRKQTKKQKTKNSTTQRTKNTDP